MTIFYLVNQTNIYAESSGSTHNRLLGNFSILGNNPDSVESEVHGDWVIGGNDWNLGGGEVF